jgi:lycopene cyclase CruA
LSAEELKSVVVNEFDKNVVKFHDASSCIKTPPLLLNGVLDYSVNVDRIVEIIRKKLPKNCVILEQHKFVRCYVRQSSVYLELEDLRQGLRKVYQSRLFIEANGINSPVAQSMDRRRSITHICPTVGTISTGFIKGENPDEVRSSRGEILVSTQDSSNHRQLLWNSFAGKSGQDEYSTYLFFYDSVESQADKSLLSLFESYFDGLNSYKRKSAGWRVIRPMFGYVPSYHHRGWQARRQKSIDRVMILGDLEGLSAPFAFSNLGLNIRDLHQTTHLTSLALEGDLLDAKSLSEIVEFQPTKAQITSLTEFLRPAPKSKASAVNETLNAVMAALQSLDEPTRKEFFRGHLTLRTLKNLLTRTAKLYPGIFQRVREHFGTKGTFLWLANMADAILKERRSGYRSQERDGNRAEQEFARYVLHYKSKPSHHEGQVST